MAGRVGLAHLRGAAERFDRVTENLGIVVFLITAKLAKGGDKFLEMLRPGMFALQETFDISGDELALHGERLAFAEFFCGRYAISTGML